MKKQFVITNDLQETSRLCADAEQFLEEAGTPPGAIYGAVLALEEMISNIIKYGYDDHADHLITATLSVQNDGVELLLEDDGHFFNPLESPAPDTDLPLQDRRIGGLGIHLVRKLAHSMNYRRTASRNQLEISIRGGRRGSGTASTVES
ncbi:MAG: ATP-binding protein [Kiritimatiellia bacterium]|nr:ATP-binding protein [Lentisphaerota bacterium]